MLTQPCPGTPASQYGINNLKLFRDGRISDNKHMPADDISYSMAQRAQDSPVSDFGHQLMADFPSVMTKKLRKLLAISLDVLRMQRPWLAKLQDQILGLQHCQATPTSLLFLPTSMLGWFKTANSFCRKLELSGMSLIDRLRFTIFLKERIIIRLEKVLIDLTIFLSRNIFVHALSTKVAVSRTAPGEETES